MCLARKEAKDPLNTNVTSKFLRKFSWIQVQHYSNEQRSRMLSTIKVGHTSLQNTQYLRWHWRSFLLQIGVFIARLDCIGPFLLSAPRLSSWISCYSRKTAESFSEMKPVHRIKAKLTFNAYVLMMFGNKKQKRRMQHVLDGLSAVKRRLPH